MSTEQDGGPANRRARNERLLIELARDVRAVRDQLGEVRGDVAKAHTMAVDTASTLAEFGPALLDSQRDLATLQGKVKALEEQLPEITNPPVPWPTLPAENAQREWRELAQWIADVLVPWYEITRAQLPDCWALHRPALVQLGWLRTNYVDAYAPVAGSTMAAEWNVRWLDAALAKIREAIPRTWCRPMADGPGEHMVHERESAQHDRGSETTRPQTGGTQPPYAHPAYAQNPPTDPVDAGAGEGMLPRQGPENQLADASYWEGYWREAMEADVAARRAREAQSGPGGGSAAG